MRTRWATLTVASGLVLAGCGSADEGTTASAPSSAAEEVRTVEHAMGTAEVTGTPERVVVLDTGELDAVLALGVTPVGAVRTGVSDELPAYIEDAGVDPAAIANVGTIAEPALEQIAALEPDLILSNAVRHADIHDRLAAIAPTVFAEAIGETWEDNLRLAGEALNRSGQAEELLSHEPPGRLAQGDADGEEIRLPEERIELHQLHPDCLGPGRIGIGIVGDDAHVEGSCETKHLGADVAYAELAEGPAGEPGAHVRAALRPAVRTLPGESVLDYQLSGER